MDFFKKAVRALGYTEVCKPYKSLNDVFAQINAYQKDLYENENSLDICKQNAVIGTENIKIINEDISYFKQKLSDDKEAKQLTKQEIKEIKEEIADLQCSLTENYDTVRVVKEVAPLIEDLIKNLNLLINGLGEIEGQMKVEEFKHLNKGNKHIKDVFYK
jgi:chromosome segregation ATPase